MDSKQDLKEEIARVAYEIYEQRGIPGMEMENWLEAERMVLEKLPARSSSKTPKKLVLSDKKSRTTKKKMLGTEV